MKTSAELRSSLRAIDHKGYPAYKSLAGAYRFDQYVLVIDHVQGDPFASPSSLHVEMCIRDRASTAGGGYILRSECRPPPTARKRADTHSRLNSRAF